MVDKVTPWPTDGGSLLSRLEVDVLLRVGLVVPLSSFFFYSTSPTSRTMENLVAYAMSRSQSSLAVYAML